MEWNRDRSSQPPTSWLQDNLLVVHKACHLRACLVSGALLLVVLGNPIWCAVSDATILRIQAEIQAGRLDTAQAEIESALKNNPQDGGLYNLRGIVHANRSEMDQAADDFNRAIRFSPRLASAYLNFGRICELKSASNPAELTRAILPYRKLLKLDPASHAVRLQLAKLLEAVVTTPVRFKSYLGCLIPRAPAHYRSHFGTPTWQDWHAWMKPRKQHRL